MLSNISGKKTWLVYQVGACEMGSEGSSSMHHLCIAQGDTKEEVIKNYVENVKFLYGYELSPMINKVGDYYDYYKIDMTEIKTSVYGNVLNYEVILNYQKHSS